MANLISNAAGRLVPNQVNGRETIPFKGIGAHVPQKNKTAPPIRSASQYPKDGNKVAPSLIEALQRANLKSGMTLSSHHHFRDGDKTMHQVFAAAKKLGVGDLVWAPTAAFPCHEPFIEYLHDGTLRRIESSLNGALGRNASLGQMNGLAVLRSHGGRYRAIQDGDLHIDLAIIAAPATDAFGNCSGTLGPTACGPLGFAFADSQYADHVIVVSDHLVPFPCAPWDISGNSVDQVVVVDEIGDPQKIVSGTTRITRSPDQLLIADYAACFVRESGIFQNGFSFQAGAGGISLAFTIYLSEMMRESNIKARFIRGGSTRYLVQMLEEGLTDYILDGQSFDLDGVRSLRDNPKHLATNPFTSYNYHGKGNFASILDCVVLGATEIDVNFNANVVTHSDGYMLHGIGGWQDALFSKCTILTAPLFRDRVPIIRDRVTTLCGVGELIDVVVTERGIAINPRRTDLIEAVRGTKLPLRSIQELKDEADSVCGGAPAPARTTEKIVGAVEWVDGTIIDSIKQVIK